MWHFESRQKPRHKIEDKVKFKYFGNIIVGTINRIQYEYGLWDDKKWRDELIYIIKIDKESTWKREPYLKVRERDLMNCHILDMIL